MYGTNAMAVQAADVAERSVAGEVTVCTALAYWEGTEVSDTAAVVEIYSADVTGGAAAE